MQETTSSTITKLPLLLALLLLLLPPSCTSSPTLRNSEQMSSTNSDSKIASDEQQSDAPKDPALLPPPTHQQPQQPQPQACKTSGCRGYSGQACGYCSNCAIRHNCEMDACICLRIDLKYFPISNFGDQCKRKGRQNHRPSYTKSELLSDIETCRSDAYLQQRLALLLRDAPEQPSKQPTVHVAIPIPSYAIPQQPTPTQPSASPSKPSPSSPKSPSTPKSQPLSPTPSPTATLVTQAVKKGDIVSIKGRWALLLPPLWSNRGPL